MKTIQQQFDALTTIRVFEILVTDKRTNDKEYILFDIDINGNNLEATHEALTTKQAKSNKIAFVSIEIDENFSLDENLQELYTQCDSALMASEFFEILD
jgi:hypothetical protein